MTLEQAYIANQKIRRDFGAITGVTKVIPNKKRKKQDKAAKKEMHNY